MAKLKGNDEKCKGRMISIHDSVWEAAQIFVKKNHLGSFSRFITLALQEYMQNRQAESPESNKLSEALEGLRKILSMS